MKTPRITIVGAGPTGLTAAIELARRGIIANVVDQKEHPSTLSRAVGIIPSTLSLLEASGVNTSLIDQGVQVQHSHLFINNKPGLNIHFKNHGPPYNFLLCLPQDKTESTLINTFLKLGGQIQYAQNVIGVTQDQNEIAVHYSDNRVESTDLLIGADGAHSTVRQALNIDFTGYDLKETWSIADIESDDWTYSTDIALYRNTKGHVFIILPIDRNRYRIVSNTRDSLSHFPAPITVNTVHREGTFNIAVRQATTYQQGNVFLAGDAAHCHSPVGGKGMNLGMTDASVLADLITQHQTERYTALRHRAGKKVITETEKIRRFITNPNNTRAINLLLKGLRLLTRLPVIQKKLVHRLLSLE